MHLSATYTTTIAAPARRVWDQIGEFAAMTDWAAPLIATSEIEGLAGIGAVRHLTHADGRQARERLLAHDDEARRFTYEMLAPLSVPGTGVRVSVQVRPRGAESEVVWTGRFQAELDSEAREAADISERQVWPALASLLAARLAQPVDAG